jgi:hypothetical protein
MRLSSVGIAIVMVLSGLVLENAEASFYLLPNPTRLLHELK